jgi:hypothetical protein
MKLIDIFKNILYYQFAIVFNWGCSSAGRALGWHSRGRGFEPLQLHHFFIFRDFHQVERGQEKSLLCTSIKIFTFIKIMTIDPSMIRLVVSQIISVIYLLLMVPLKEPFKKNLYLFLSVTFIVVTMNGLIIISQGIEFYIRFYFITLLLPYIVLMSFIAHYKARSEITICFTIGSIFRKFFGY